MEGKEEIRDKEIGQDDKDFECNGCRLTGKLIESLIKHMNSTQVGFQCEECKVPAELVEKIESHMK